MKKYPGHKVIGKVNFNLQPCRIAIAPAVLHFYAGSKRAGKLGTVN
jgi:hypothetical protein